jgi:uncharacterized protein YkwD
MGLEECQKFSAGVLAHPTKSTTFRRNFGYSLLMKFCRILLILGFVLSGCSAGINQPNSSIPSSSSNGANSASAQNQLNPHENELLQLINTLREQSGVGPLAVDPTLQSSASLHSGYMESNSTLTHSEPAPNVSSGERIANSGGNFSFTGENIADGNIDAASTFNQWYASPDHLANMISPSYQFIGISQNGIYWTTDFGGMNNP